jgi:hypothetical protein
MPSICRCLSNKKTGRHCDAPLTSQVVGACQPIVKYSV